MHLNSESVLIIGGDSFTGNHLIKKFKKKNFIVYQTSKKKKKIF